jgi:Kdo2-lipid IVA lauroyltransferase/acyltransferase
MSRGSVGKRIKNWLIYLVVVFFVNLLRNLSRIEAMHVTRFLACIAFRLAGHERDKTIRHLTWAFGQEKPAAEIRRLARQVFLHWATAAVDAVRMPLLIRQGKLNTLVRADGLDRVKHMLARGRGVLALTGHFGNWEILGAWLVQNGFPLRVVGTSAYDPRLDKMIVEARNQAGYTNIPRGKGTREIIRSLHEGCMLGLLIDQDTKVEGEFVDFFGRPAHTATGPVVLAQKFNAPLIAIFIHMHRDLTYHIECGDEIILEHTGNEKRDLIVNLQKCSDEYERMIRRFPSQWVWMHERWKKKPNI